MPRGLKYPDVIVILEAQMVAYSGARYREVSEYLGIPLSTVNIHINKRVKELDIVLYKAAKKEAQLHSSNQRPHRTKGTKL